MSADTPAAPARVRLLRLGLSEEYSWAQIGLSTVVALAPAVFLVAMVLAGSEFTWWLLVFAPLAAFGAARPESTGHLVLWVLLLVVWVVSVPGPFTWWSVPAALTVAGSHTALVLLAGRPASGDLAADTWARVRSRLGVVAGIVIGVAVLAQVVRSVRVPGQPALAVMSLVGVSVWLWVGTRSADPPES
jgi:hypothetical protein